MKKSARGPLIYLLGFVLVFLLITWLTNVDTVDESVIEYDEFLRYVEEGKIEQVVIVENELYALATESEINPEAFPTKYDYYTYLPSVEQFNEDMREITNATSTSGYPFDITYEPVPEASFFEALLPYLIPMILIVVVFYFIMRQQQGAGNKALSFGKSRARMQVGDKNKKTFADVAGADEEKEELAEIVEFLKNPKRFLDLGARIPKGVLLVGPPGGGKTLLAKAVAGEAGVPFFSISGSDFVEMFVGVGASRVRDMFDNAKKNSPCILFIDEIDAVGRQRGSGMGGGHDEREQTLNQLLVEMDGFQVNEGIIILAATNRKDILDPALLRPGRFDRQVFINYPDIKGREDILRVHSKGKPFGDDVNLKVLAKRTPGFIGADLENVLNEAAILTARAKKQKIGMKEIEEAITRVIAGPEKRSRVITEKDKRCTAYHEVGHAICAKAQPECDPVHEISIIPRGVAAGYTMTLPEEDSQHVFKSKLLAELTMMLGGRAAEALVLGDVSTGAISDLQRASETARNMVIKYGMSDVIGPVFLGSSQELFLGKEIGHTKTYSEEWAFKVDEEVKSILDGAIAKAQVILKEKIDLLHKGAEALIEREKIHGDEFDKLWNGEDLPPMDDNEDKATVQNAEEQKEKESEPKQTDDK
ncbi:MAG: ATP-dependent zinc metalloprotease FtsH [Eubacteriales bacterium]|nr:ATP-dependent zinc metalloprotease FtsH [Eubacteriales bacterium]